MRAELVRFGVVRINEMNYEYDVIIDGGQIHKRKKEPSKPYRAHYGHTPLSAAEQIPWGGEQLIIGTGAYGRLPIMEDVYTEAKKCSVEIIQLPTVEACQVLLNVPLEDIYAILHVTC